METPLNASASTAGALFSKATFEVPQFQRDYSWTLDEVKDFWTDLQSSLVRESYFLGLVILTDEGGRKTVVDGQQRLITITLLAIALYYEARSAGRMALADRVQADFLRSIDYDTDEEDPRIVLSSAEDNETLTFILETGKAPSIEDNESVSFKIAESYKFILRALRKDLDEDPFKRLGRWTDFITNSLYFAVFVHPDPALAYQVFEVINTRGKELTTADLLKNYVLSQTKKLDRERRYQHWKFISRSFNSEGSNNFVQYIRHVVTVKNGHILPKNLFAFLARRIRQGDEVPPSSDELMQMLDQNLPLYLQMIDPSSDGPGNPDELKVYQALNDLNVIAIRPILLALHGVPDAMEGLRYMLRLVVRRVVVGNLGTGNVERKFGEAAQEVNSTKDWKVLRKHLGDLNPTKSEFIHQLARRSFNKGILQFLRRSILEGTITPESDFPLHFIAPRHAFDWSGFTEEERSYWTTTIGNTFLATVDRRPNGTSNWDGFMRIMLPLAAPIEDPSSLTIYGDWDSTAVEVEGEDLADAAAQIWFR